MNRYTRGTLVLEITMILAALAFLFPVYVLVNIALKAPTELTPGFVPPTQPTFDGFVEAWAGGRLVFAVMNSAIVTVVSVLLIVAIGALAAYPLARVTRSWSRWLFVVFILGLLLPFQLALIPLYTTIRDLGLLGTLPSLVLFYVGREMPFAVFLFVTFLRALPREYEEAAAIDGAGPLRTFRSVVFPLLGPVVGTVAILTAVFVYNDFFTPLLYLSGSGNQTVTVALSQFVGEYRSQWNVVFAGLMVSSAPILIAYFVLQKQIIRGFGGGLKG